MEALSVRQPWAWLIVRRKKLFENRDWSPGYAARRKVVHGKRILIHAAAVVGVLQFQGYLIMEEMQRRWQAGDADDDDNQQEGAW